MEELDVAIVGGGPGGLAAAAAILTARPELRVAVFERSSLRPRGASLGLQPNGVRALGAISPKLEAAVRQLDSQPGIRRHFADDDSLISIKDEDGPLKYVARHGGGPIIMCAWHSLQTTLAAELPEGVLRQQAPLDRYAEAPADGNGQGAGPTLHFKPGTHPPVNARLVVGADGSQSGVRVQLLDDGPPLFADTAIWRAVQPRPSWWFPEPGTYCIFGTPPHMMLCFGLVDGSVAWQAFGPWPKERLDEIGGGRMVYISDAVARREEGEARRARALEVFGGGCSMAVSLIKEADALAITEHGQFYHTAEACKVWGRCRVSLLGDAAHLSTPILSQGTAQAFEDALALGRAIGEHGATPQALRAYEMEPIHEESVRLFLDYRAGGAPPQEHLDNDRIGAWMHELAPLKPATAAGAAA
ncbi:hypothetical protein ABPG75_004001 [Micractinium tetrahymenae]